MKTVKNCMVTKNMYQTSLWKFNTTLFQQQILKKDNVSKNF